MCVCNLKYAYLCCILYRFFPTISYINFFHAFSFLISLLAVLGPCCCMEAFSSRAQWGPLSGVVHSLPIAVAS